MEPIETIGIKSNSNAVAFAMMPPPVKIELKSEITSNIAKVFCPTANLLSKRTSIELKRVPPIKITNDPSFINIKPKVPIDVPKNVQEVTGELIGATAKVSITLLINILTLEK